MPSLSARPSQTPSVSSPPSVSVAPTTSVVPVTVFIGFDRFPQEIGWKIESVTDRLTVIEVLPGSYPSGTASAIETVMLEPFVHYRIEFQDTAGDGLCCFWGYGSASVYRGTEVDVDNLLFEIPSSFSSLYRRVFQVFPDTSMPSVSPSLSEIPSVVPSTSPAPSLSSAPTIDGVPVTVFFHFDDNPQEISWKVESGFDQVPVIEILPGTYPSGTVNATETIILAPGIQVLTIEDTGGDGLCCGFGVGRVYVYKGAEVDPDRLLFFIYGFSIGSFYTRRFQVFPDTSMPSVSPSISAVPSLLPSSSSPPSSSFAPSAKDSRILVVLELDRYPGETGWRIETSNGEVVVNVPSNTYSSLDTEVSRVVTVTPGADYVITFTDSVGDGMCCSYGFGQAFVYLGTTRDPTKGLVYEDGRFRTSSRHTFSTDDVMTFDTSAPSELPTAAPSIGPTLTSAPSMKPTISQSPSQTASPTSPATAVMIEVHLDRYPLETGWKLESTNGTLIAEVAMGGYDASYAIETHIVDLEGDTECIITFEDFWGDGMCCARDGRRGEAFVFYGRNHDMGSVLVHEDGEFTYSSSHNFVVSRDNVIQPDGVVNPTISPSAKPGLTPKNRKGQKAPKLTQPTN